MTKPRWSEFFKSFLKFNQLQFHSFDLWWKGRSWFLTNPNPYGNWNNAFGVWFVCFMNVVSTNWVSNIISSLSVASLGVYLWLALPCSWCDVKIPTPRKYVGFHSFTVLLSNPYGTLRGHEWRNASQFYNTYENP